MIHNFLVLGLIFGTLFYFGLLTPYYSSNSFPCYDIPYTSNHFVPYFSSFPLYISSDPSTTLDDAFTGSSFVRRPSIVLAITSFPNLISLLRHQHHLGPHSYHSRHPSPTVWSPTERHRQFCIDLHAKQRLKPDTLTGISLIVSRTPSAIVMAS